MVITIVGGDIKSILTAKYLQLNGHSIYFCGFENFEPKTENQIDEQKALEISDYIVLPLPTSRDNETVIAPFSKNKIYLSSFKNWDKRENVLCGNLSSEFGFSEYYTEALKQKNAIPSAEGALMIAMQQSEKTLWQSNCLVLGFGRIGKILTERLLAFGANVTATARKAEGLIQIAHSGAIAMHTGNIEKNIHEPEIIFNTIPSMVLPKALIKKCRPDCLIIDLASGAGGVDYVAAKEFGINAIHALALPAKTSPQTAAKLIAEEIEQRIRTGVTI